MRAASDTEDPRRDCARGCSAAHVSAGSYLWALAGVLSSPCNSTTPWHHCFPAARLRSTPRPVPPELACTRRLSVGSDGTSAPSQVLANAQITPRAAFMRCPGGALPTARYSSLGTEQRATSCRQGALSRSPHSPLCAAKPTEGGATSEVRPPRARGRRVLRDKAAPPPPPASFE